jgi:hypothetical protein
MNRNDVHPVSVRALLFGEVAADDAAAALARSLDDHGVVGTAGRGFQGLAAPARKAVDHEVAKVAMGLMEIDLGDSLVAGWRQYACLKDSARRTLQSPGSEEVVSLATHRITSGYRPRVDLFLDGVKVNSFEFELDAVFDVSGLAAVMSAGQLVALRGGQCQLAVRLRLEGLTLVERHRSLTPGWLVPLPRPVTFADAPTAAVPDIPLQREESDSRLLASSPTEP